MIVGTVEATFLILLVVVIFGPILAERLRVPGIIGLIFGGMLFGPYVIDWLEDDALVTDLGAIGILYLMFLAGVSFDFRAFRENRRAAVAYGLLGFAIPFTLSAVVMLGISDVSMLAAGLIGAMWASNTLVAYPEVQAAGLQRNRAVSAAVSAGVVADLLSLTVMAFVTSTAVIDLDVPDGPFDGELTDLVGELEITPSTPDPTLPLWLGLLLLAGFCLWLLPKIAAWFFVRIGRTRTQRFVFSLAGMSAGATVALLGGMEGLVGAFLAGLGMNRLVPARGPLMERLDFVGSSVFVPTFLVSIGLNIDPAALIDRTTLVVGALFTLFVVVGKSAAALITGKVFGLSFSEVGLMSSLSFGQAASTLAIAQVGLSLRMFDQVVVNASVLAIVATALITSFGTRFFASKVPKPTAEKTPIGEHVLLDVRPHGSDVESVIALAAGIAASDDGLVVPYGITRHGELGETRAMVAAAADAVAAQGLDADGVVRVDESFTDGTLHLVDEHAVSLVVLSWTGPRFPLDYLFGNDIDAIGEQSPVPVMAANVVGPWSRVVIGIGTIDSDWRREDARLAVDVATRLVLAHPVPLVVAANDESAARELVAGPDVEHLVVGSARDVLGALEPTDLVVAPAHVLHDLSPLDERRLAKAIIEMSLVVVAGPNRLSFSKGVTRRPLSSTVVPPVHSRDV